ncbi:MAG: Mut7-C RNAse domain-containing protein [Pseudothermotoga sp.]
MFFADRMLGKLAKKLRLLGFDTIYLSDIDEQEILILCKQTGRILITRDRSLHLAALKNRVKSVLIKSDDWRDQLSELLSYCDLRHGAKMSRCSLCNVVLVPVSLEQVRDRVPLYVQQTQNEFYSCPVCGRVYWAGSHVDHLLEEFRRLKL